MRSFWRQVLVALIGAAGAVIAALIGVAVHKNKEIHYIAQVVENGSQQKPIAQAQVQLGVGSDIQTKFTDKDGMAAFVYIPPEDSGPGHAVVRASGFSTEDLPIPHGNQTQVFRLEALSAGSSVASVTSPENPNTPPKLAPYERDSVLGPVPSGSMKNFSDWYVVTAEAPAPGYQFDLATSSYQVTGDRQCPGGGYSECYWIAHDAQHLAFHFRLQGHDEWSTPGQGFSVGRLHAVYIPSPPK